MTFVQLRYILTIAETKSMNKAAELLYVSQPSLTNAVKELEKEIGITIFFRSGRGVTLTDDGAEFLLYAKEICMQYEQLLQRYEGSGIRKEKFGVSTQHYSFAVKAFVDVAKNCDMSKYEFAIRETRTEEIIHDVRTMRSEIGVLYLSSFNRKSMEKLLKSADDGKMIQEGIRTVILGKPNAGKSSLLNFLVGEDRAIVTEIAGTTRDTLEEYISLHGISLRIIDTAGIRETEDIVEKIGVEKARQMAEKADLILYVVDSSKPLDKNDEEIMELLQGRKSIIIYNKTDLTPVVSSEALEEKTGKQVIPVSVVEETGIEKLETAIKEMFFRGEISFNDEVYITNARHKTALEEAEKSLNMVMQSIEAGMPEDFFSIDLMGAYESLGKIMGESLGEDLVNEIFSKFCVGK